MKKIIDKTDKFLAGIWRNDMIWMFKIAVLLWCVMYALWKVH